MAILALGAPLELESWLCPLPDGPDVPRRVRHAGGQPERDPPVAAQRPPHRAGQPEPDRLARSGGDREPLRAQADDAAPAGPDPELLRGPASEPPPDRERVPVPDDHAQRTARPHAPDDRQAHERPRPERRDRLIAARRGRELALDR